MNTLTTIIAEHRVNRHPLFRYLRTHAEDAVSWDIFATHHHRAVAPTLLALSLVRARLHTEAKEILDHLLDNTLAERLLVPPGFTPMGDLCNDLEHLREVESFTLFYTVSMKIKPIPTALGILYPLCVTPEWVERMDLIIQPFVERFDLLLAGTKSALDIRTNLWDGIFEAVTGREVKHDA